VLKARQTVKFEPGMIHAVMSPNNSAIAGWDYVKGEWLEAEHVQRQMLWEAGLGKQQKLGLLAGDLYDLTRYLDGDLELWSLLAAKDNKHKESIQSMIETIRAFR